jgi:hypothetical protein
MYIVDFNVFNKENPRKVQVIDLCTCLMNKQAMDHKKIQFGAFVWCQNFFGWIISCTCLNACNICQNLSNFVMFSFVILLM